MEVASSINLNEHTSYWSILNREGMLCVLVIKNKTTRECTHFQSRIDEHASRQKIKNQKDCCVWRLIPTYQLIKENTIGNLRIYIGTRHTSYKLSPHIELKVQGSVIAILPVWSIPHSSTQGRLMDGFGCIYMFKQQIKTYNFNTLYSHIFPIVWI